MRALAFCLLFGAWCCPAAAQELRFRRITTANGLSDNGINALCQDRSGFLWIGTDNGLDRWDGRHARLWHVKDGLAGEQVTAVLEDGQGTIWAAAAQGGVSRFSASGDLVATYRPHAQDPRSFADVRINCLFDLNDSILLIGAQRVPLIFLHKRTGACTYWDGLGPIAPARALQQPPTSTDWCHYIMDLGDGRLAIGFLLGYRQLLVDRSSGAVLGSAFHMDPAADQTIACALLAGGELYGAGWQHRLHVQHLASATGTTWPLPDDPTCLLALDSLHLLAGTAATGLLRINRHNGAWTTHRYRRGDPATLSDDRVSCVLRDRDGRIWVGTRNGLNLHAPDQWWAESTTLTVRGEQGSGQPAVYGIEQAQDGRLVVFTAEGSFILGPDRTFRHIPLSWANGKHLRATTLLETGFGDFIGAEEGVMRLASDGRKALAIPLAYAGLADPLGMDSLRVRSMPALFQVRSLMADTINGAPVLVMGVRGYGVAVLDLLRGSLEWYSTTPGQTLSLGSNLTNKLIRHQDGSYWVATSHGLYQWQLDRQAPRNRFRAFHAGKGPDQLPAEDITDLLVDPRGLLWIATRNGGLSCWNGRAMRHCPLPEAAGSTVLGLAMDKAGRIWCAARGGYGVLDTALAQWALLPLPEAGEPDNMPTFTKGLHDGRIAFIANGNLHLFDPLQVHLPGPPPPPYVTRLDQGDEQGPLPAPGGILELAAQDGLLRVAVSTLDLAPAYPYRFTFELEGMDPVPRSAGRDGSMVYASLPAGTYRILARTVAADGTASPPVAIATVHKAAPFWQQGWFFLAAAALIWAVAYAVSRYRHRQDLRLQHVRNRIAGDLHDEVGSSLSAITMGSQLAAKLHGDATPQVQEILARIGETSSASLRSMSDIVWAIDPGHDEGEALVARMKRIAEELLASKGVNIAFSLAGDVEGMKLPMGVRKDLVLIFKEAVHNCSKHAAAQNLLIGLERLGSRLRLRIRDDGRGFDPLLHPDGHGLGSMARRAAALGARLQLQSAPGEGTLIELETDLAKIRD
jgi:signal transduction histidine kinase/sugar lactone lactonase YvrE